jgi:SAM-dependent methyltransferase
MPGVDRLEVPTRFRKGPARDERASTEAASRLIDTMCARIGLESLAESEVLDVGCGVNFTQAILNMPLPVKRYVGVDVDREMITYLRDNVADSRFEFVHVDVHNERYNPTGSAFTNDTQLTLGDRRFDVVCLFSVFTHLAPHDYRTMLRVLRRVVKPTGRLFYTLYVDEITEGGHGLMDAWWAKLVDAEPAERVIGSTATGSSRPAAMTTATFIDLDPKQPLRWALYSEAYARELIQGTGWDVVSLSPPEEHIQHHFVCAPTDATPSRH